MTDELEEIKRRKLEQLKTKYMKGGKNNMSENMPDKPIHIDDSNIDSTVKKYPVMVVDCWAPWCGPCRMVGPVVEELARQMKGKVVFGKLNVDENRGISMKYGIMSIPTLLMFKNGKLIDTFIGAMPEPILKAKIESNF
jgi:thioredoxin 1